MPERIRCTPAKYLALERAVEYRNQYIDGFMIPMTVSNPWHGLIKSNISRHLGNQLENSSCEVYVSLMRVKAGKSYLYPDVVVMRGTAQLEDAEQDTLLNPTLIVEVLDRSTETFDRGKKFSHYREIATLQDYILIAHDEVAVEHFVRQGELWVLHATTSLDDTLQLPSIGCTLSIAQIYQRIEFPPSDESTD